MPQYLTSAGLVALGTAESQNNPTSIERTSPTCTVMGLCSSATGTYQFLTGTWQAYAPKAGVDLAAYPVAADAPAAVQDQVAAITPISNWTCAGCDDRFAQNLQSNPEWISSSPTGATNAVAASGGTTGGITSISQAVSGNADNFSTFGLSPVSPIVSNNTIGSELGNAQADDDYGYFGANPLATTTTTGASGTGTATTSGSTVSPASGAAAAATTAMAGSAAAFWQAIGTFFERSGLVLLGIVLLGAAAIALSEHKTEVVRWAKA